MHAVPVEPAGVENGCASRKLRKQARAQADRSTPSVIATDRRAGQLLGDRRLRPTIAIPYLAFRKQTTKQASHAKELPSEIPGSCSRGLTRIGRATGRVIVHNQTWTGESRARICSFRPRAVVGVRTWLRRRRARNCTCVAQSPVGKSEVATAGENSLTSVMPILCTEKLVGLTRVGDRDGDRQLPASRK